VETANRTTEKKQNVSVFRHYEDTAIIRAPLSINSDTTGWQNFRDLSSGVGATFRYRKATTHFQPVGRIFC